jgi:hypothetical protein
MRAMDSVREGVLRVTNETVTSKPTSGNFVRPVAALGLVATALGRAVSPALRGVGDGMDQIIKTCDLLGDLATYLFAFAAMAATVAQLALTMRDRRFGSVYRSIATGLGSCVVLVVLPALLRNLPERASLVAAAASGLLALVAAREALFVPRTRALGVVLAACGLAALLHLSSAWLVAYAGERGLYRLVVVARGLATAAVGVDSLGLVTALAWLATRNRGLVSWGTRAALVVACVLTWGALQGGQDGGPLWELVAHRAVQRLLTLPQPYVWPPYRYLIEAFAPLLALVAIVVPRQIPAIMGALALVLLARPATDVPLAALAVTLASLSAPLAAKDDKGMWAVLLAA